MSAIRCEMCPYSDGVCCEHPDQHVLCLEHGPKRPEWCPRRRTVPLAELAEPEGPEDVAAQAASKR